MTKADKPDWQEAKHEFPWGLLIPGELGILVLGIGAVVALFVFTFLLCEDLRFKNWEDARRNGGIIAMLLFGLVIVCGLLYLRFRIS